MSALSTFRVQFTETTHEITSKARNELFVGRSPAMNIIDNRISRKQLRFFTENGTPFVQRIGLSESRKSDVVLEKNQVIPVKDGDEFTLFLDQYPFVLHVNAPEQSRTTTLEELATLETVTQYEPRRAPLEATFPTHIGSPSIIPDTLPSKKQYSDQESSDAHNFSSDDQREEDEEEDAVVSDESGLLGSSEDDDAEDKVKSPKEGAPVPDTRRKSGPGGTRTKRPNKTSSDDDNDQNTKKRRNRKELPRNIQMDSDDDQMVSKPRRSVRSAKPKSDLSAYRAYVKATKPAVKDEYPNENDRHISKLLKGRWERMKDEEKKEFYGAGGRKEN